MRLYKITSSVVQSPAFSDKPGCTLFVGTQAEAASARVKFMAQGATRKEIESVEVDVPTDKAGLMAFLNELVSK